MKESIFKVFKNKICWDSGYTEIEEYYKNLPNGILIFSFRSSIIFIPGINYVEKNGKIYVATIDELQQSSENISQIDSVGGSKGSLVSDLPKV